ncbi:MerR family transcriptional regulator [Luteipulveratus sp. YIM 133132]|uniref:MerR family transcriptional regulator n=1 Tax=Luteipulveratus flavus TaxID=3031728 RepID=A0ABT6CCY1_9MICO|nr:MULTISPECIES: MerR family transcriptional regulator [unclassified Luteipulveratus]MDE9367367.1 MerR family transcriptional regulator [Luteipulveratus sp. YIM 133132]MDF8266252.1 MerR family transcriptional regulator [Luteipulveratus sp. YIM 133296]
MTSPSGRGLTIGAVLERLRSDFPDLTVSKVRFLDTEGLVSPQRRDSGYREYSERDIERLRFVLTAQRDRFWPLRVIRDALDAFDRGLPPEEGPSGGLPAVPPPVGDDDLPSADDLSTPLRRLRLTRAELSDGSGLAPSQVTELETFHLITADAEGYFGEADLTVARAAEALAAYGVSGRHLRAFRLAADREIGLVEQTAGSDGAKRADVLARCLTLHVALVRAGLQEGRT